MQELLKKQIQSITKQRQLTLVMDNAKWLKLITAIESLSFPPPFIRKDLFSQSPKLSDFTSDVYHVGNWLNGINPLVTVEWIKVRPRFLRNMGQPVTTKIIDCTKAFEELLINHRIPFIHYKNAYVIYSYMGFDNLLVGHVSP